MDSPNNDVPFERDAEHCILLTDGPQRAPQRNDANRSCHCACLCSSSQNDDDLISDDSRIVFAMSPSDMEHENNRDSSMRESDEAQVDGEEGVEGPLIELGGYGLVSLPLIWRSIARHSRCTCHSGILSHADDYPFASIYNSQMPSGFQSPLGSLAVEADGSEHDMASSQILSVCSRSSSVLFHVGAGQSYTLPPFPLIYSPLRLTEEVPFEYPPESDEVGSQFGISKAEFVEYNAC